MDISGSQVWFTDLWNYSIVPYLLDAVKEGLQVSTNLMNVQLEEYLDQKKNLRIEQSCIISERHLV